MATKTVLASIVALTAFGVAAHAQENAGEHREVGAHAHGVSTLQVAVEGGTVEMELHAPGMDIVGFEHAAESAADKATVQSALDRLAAAETLFVFDEAAGCRLTQAATELETGEHEEHAHDEEGHVRAEEASQEVVEGEAEAEHVHEESEGGHTEFHIRYSFTCDTPEALDAIALPFFEVFPGAQQIEAQVVTDAGATAVEVVRSAPRLPLR